MGAALHQLDVVLNAGSVVEVQLVAALHDLNEHIHSQSHVGLGGAVIGAHGADEVVDSALSGLVQTQLIGHAGLQRGSNLPSGSGGLIACGGTDRLVAALTGVDNDVEHTDLSSQLGDEQGVHGSVKGDGHHGAVHGHGAIQDGGSQIGGVGILIIVAVEDDGGHTGARNGHSRSLIEADGIALAAVVAYIRAGAGLIVGHGDAVLRPHLLLGGIGNAVGLVGEVDGSRTGRHSADGHGYQQAQTSKDRDQFFHWGMSSLCLFFTGCAARCGPHSRT